MEFEEVSEQIEREARRVAAAFGVEEWQRKDDGEADSQYRRLFTFHSLNARPYISWCISQWYSHARRSGEELEVSEFTISQDEVASCLSLAAVEPPLWLWIPRKGPTWFAVQLFARGLYRWGFTDESILSQLPELSAHEKLELRLSLPREFWPQKWLEEEANLGGGSDCR